MTLLSQKMFQYPSQPVAQNKGENRALFEIKPLYPGYGTTLGNAMRRVLLSSIEGAGVTSMRVKGVDHEFTSIPGVLEDVLDIIAHLKKVRFRVHTDERVTLTLSAKGQKEVTASEIKTTADVEVVNPDQLLFTIADKKTEIEMEITVERGIGYVPVEQRQKEKLTVGEIAIDAIFTPIQNVNFTVENIRVGQRTDYNKILLDITTDGSITPEEAFKKTNEILIKHFQIINGDIAGEVSADEAAESDASEMSDEN